MNLEQKFNKSLEHNWRVRFETSHPDEDAYDGIIICNKSDFIVPREESDFEFDGIIIPINKHMKSKEGTGKLAI